MISFTLYTVHSTLYLSVENVNNKFKEITCKISLYTDTLSFICLKFKQIKCCFKINDSYLKVTWSQPQYNLCMKLIIFLAEIKFRR